MRSFRIAILLVVLCASLPFALAQVPLTARPPQMPPLLFVKLIGPPGMRVTVYRGQAPAQSFETPCTLGVRQAFSIKVAITGVPDFPNDVFFSTLEVRGSLMLANRLKNAEFPAALIFSTEDFIRIKSNATLKKVVVLEKPETAIPVATKPDEPFEINL